MRKMPCDKNKKQPVTSKTFTADATENAIHRLAFDNSFQANIISTVNEGRIILANKAACQLLGYSNKEILTKNRAAIFDINEDSFKKMLKQRAAEGQSTALVTGIKKSGKSFTCEMTSAVFINDGIEQAVTTLTDMSQSILKQKKIDAKSKKRIAENIAVTKSRQKKLNIKNEKIVADDIIVAKAKSDARLAENNEWIKYIAKTSYDVMWDWDIASGEIYVGDSIEEVFGYRVQNNTVNYNDFIQCLLQDEKVIVEKKLLKVLASDNKSWDDSYMFKRNNGSVAFTTSRASIVRDEDKKALRLIGATQDVSKLQELENKLEEQTTVQEQDINPFLPDAKHFFDVIWHWNVVTDELFIGEQFEALFGHAIKNNICNIIDWNNYIHPDDKEAVKKSLEETLESSTVNWQYNYRLIRANGSIANVFVRASIFRHANGKANRIIGILQDRSRLQEQENGAIEMLRDKKGLLIDKIKNVVTELVLFSDELVQINYSTYLSKKLQYDYTYLANLFSSIEGISIQKFIIAQKISRVKELIVSDTLNLTEISRKLHYSSVAHLSNQFKKVTGLTPSEFKQLDQTQRTTPANV
ncbi:MAG: PAS domain-containing protein [Bacteroidota bacterium]|nr:PAS domain-containing protein [Bacteroidota bacterium]